MEKFEENTLSEYWEVLMAEYREVSIDWVDILPALKYFYELKKSWKIHNQKIIVDGIEISTFLDLKGLEKKIDKKEDMKEEKVKNTKVILWVKLCKNLVLKTLSSSFDTVVWWIIDQNI